MEGARHFDGAFDGFGAGIGEEDEIGEARGGECFGEDFLFGDFEQV